MSIPQLIAKHVREAHTGGNWTCVNVKDTLADVSVEEANATIGTFNTIATLLAHVNYYVRAVTGVLHGDPLTADDAESFDHSPAITQAEWESRVARAIADGEQFAALIEQMPERKLLDYLAEEKYGIYYRNLHGIVEHLHYHLGQIVMLKRILRQMADGNN